VTAEKARERWVLLLQRGEPGSLYEAAAMAAAATALGIGVTLVWFDAALEALVSEGLDEPAAPATATDRPEAAAALLQEARETGLLRSLACSASAVGQRAGVERVREMVDEIVGWPTAIGLIRAADKAFVW
jgi:predicted peroxiredoxin